ncbi:hypothetical protein RvY_10915 [Ramazzottius varieornatus]|uniref:Cilia- and flagella-associated protein 299 n=1 Tax=Ramazzottius varieornatus TaxID=947166 RepID=A0A1D1VED1_RAMVA|nr:hypothetical protein RvY_10915 [Ramazzottius varieornatus]
MSILRTRADKAPAKTLPAPHAQPHTKTEEDEDIGNVVTLTSAIRTFDTYDDYLDSQLTEEDLFYFGDHRLAQTILEQGFDRNREKFTRRKFNQAKEAAEHRIQAIEAARVAGVKSVKAEDAGLRELARRKYENESGRLATIIFLRTRNTKGQEISAYIDFAHRLTVDPERWRDIISGKTRLEPEETDLSFYNWSTRASFLNDSLNFTVSVGKDCKVKFKHKKDHQSVRVSRFVPSKNNSFETPESGRTKIQSKTYAQVTLFDHWVRFWSTSDEYDGRPLSRLCDEVLLNDNVDLPGAVGAALVEEDLLQIARNALGILPSKRKQSVWETREAMDQQTTSGLQILQSSVADTLNLLYDMEVHDQRNAILGTFDYRQLTAQFEKLLPARFRNWTHGPKLDQPAQDGRTSFEHEMNAAKERKKKEETLSFDPTPYLSIIRRLAPRTMSEDIPELGEQESNHTLQSPLTDATESLLTAIKKSPVTGELDTEPPILQREVRRASGVLRTHLFTRRNTEG